MFNTILIIIISIGLAVFYAYLDCSLSFGKIICQKRKSLVTLLGGPIIWGLILIIVVFKTMINVGSLLHKHLVEPYIKWLKRDD